MSWVLQPQLFSHLLLLDRVGARHLQSGRNEPRDSHCVVKIGVSALRSPRGNCAFLLRVRLEFGRFRADRQRLTWVKVR